MDTIDRRRAAPVLLAGAIALVYLIVDPPSYDLAAQLLRTKLFSAEGFGLWNNWWYGGHDTLAYSVLFGPLAAATSPQLIGALAAVITAALFSEVVTARYGARGELGALWFAAATSVSLFSGRLTFALGLMFALGALLALTRRRPLLTGGLSVLAALSSPVAALFTALVGVTVALRAAHERDGSRSAVGLGVILCSLLPVLALSVAFPEGGTEPYAFSSLWPVPVIAVMFVALAPAQEAAVKLGAALYAGGCVLAYAIPSPIGANAGRLAPLLAGPLAALVWSRRRTAWLLAAAAPLLYLQWQAPARDVITSAQNPAVSASYWRPLLRFLGTRHGAPFRVEIPFTASHWEAYYVAPRFPLARGWERQLDERDNALFYDGTLTAPRYEVWLHALAIRFVAVAAGPVDSSARQELALIDRGLPYLRLVWASPRFRVYAVRDPTPIAQGPVTLTAYGPSSLTLVAHAPGRVVLHVRYSPYWELGRGSGCVSPAGGFTALTLRRPGRVRVVIGFSLGRIGARSPRCSS
ncbi:MAG TPA: hypothetical protein VG223_16990 [Solirubrobacteraceae bacterium]|nr:hypothetical protein [Solirubrobacteraceae bacterium]